MKRNIFIPLLFVVIVKILYSCSNEGYVLSHSQKELLNDYNVNPNELEIDAYFYQNIVSKKVQVWYYKSYEIKEIRKTIDSVSYVHSFYRNGEIDLIATMRDNKFFGHINYLDSLGVPIMYGYVNSKEKLSTQFEFYENGEFKGHGYLLIKDSFVIQNYQYGDSLELLISCADIAKSNIDITIEERSSIDSSLIERKVAKTPNTNFYMHRPFDDFINNRITVTQPNSKLDSIYEVWRIMPNTSKLPR